MFLPVFHRIKVHSCSMYANRGERIWTFGHSLPKRVLYQTELHPVNNAPVISCRITLTGSRGIPPLSHMGCCSDSFFSRRCEPGCIPVPYALIIADHLSFSKSSICFLVFSDFFFSLSVCLYPYLPWNMAWPWQNMVTPNIRARTIPIHSITSVCPSMGI